MRFHRQPVCVCGPGTNRNRACRHVALEPREHMPRGERHPVVARLAYRLFAACRLFVGRSCKAVNSTTLYFCCYCCCGSVGVCLMPLKRLNRVAMHAPYPHSQSSHESYFALALGCAYCIYPSRVNLFDANSGFQCTLLQHTLRPLYPTLWIPQLATPSLW